jgi:hypothetical protein
MISLNEFDLPDDESLSEEKRVVLEKLRACDDIVHGWDDPGDFSIGRRLSPRPLRLD